MNYVRSPLRYPGGKQKDVPLLSKILKQFEQKEIIQEYREPFLGGGSLLLYSIANLSAKKYWGNDAYPLLIDFWKQTQENVEELCDLVSSYRDVYEGPPGRSTDWTEFRINYLQKLNNGLSENVSVNRQLYNAARFFILNRSTASGTTESGGLTPRAYCERFTESSIERLRNLKGYFDNKNTKFTNYDYERLLRGKSKGIFIFLDPPYLSAEKSALYGKSGSLHKGFDHKLLAQRLHKCNHSWLMTIDNSPEIQELYSQWAYINYFYGKKPYSMTNINSDKNAPIKDNNKLELLISSFKIDLNELIENKPDEESIRAKSAKIKSVEINRKNGKDRSLSLSSL